MTVKWKVDSFSSHDNMFGKKDVVYAVHFRVIGPTNVVHGTTGVAFNPNIDFKPIDQVTERDCLNWIVSSLSVEVQNDLQNKALEKVENITTRSL